jgi:hypothetical protein
MAGFALSTEGIHNTLIPFALRALLTVEQIASDLIDTLEHRVAVRYIVYRESSQATTNAFRCKNVYSIEVSLVIQEALMIRCRGWESRIRPHSLTVGT